MNGETTKSTGTCNEIPAPEKKKGSLIVKMIIGCTLGLLLFCIPLPWGGGKSTMLISYLKELADIVLKRAMQTVGLGIMVISFFGTLYALATRKKEHSKFFNMTFHPSVLNIVVRFAALLISALVFFNIGPELLVNENTGGLMFSDLIVNLIVYFWLGTVLLYFLTDFGLMELAGSLVERFFRPLFRIPARSVVLCLSAWFGSGTVQLIPIEQEYKKGRLTGREASIICVSFCTIPFGAYMAYSLGITGLDSAYFGGYVITLVIITILSTIIMCRIPPLSRITDSYYEGKKNTYEEGKGGIIQGFNRAYEKVKTAPSIGGMVKNGTSIALNLYFEVFPIVVALGTLVTILVEYTPIFDFIATPFVPALQALGIPEAARVAPALFTGFADLLLPFIAGAGITSQYAKFILCVLGVSQIICMTETGLIMSKSAVPLNVGKLLLIFLEKTVIAFFVAVAMGKLLGIPV